MTYDQHVILISEIAARLITEHYIVAVFEGTDSHRAQAIGAAVKVASEILAETTRQVRINYDIGKLP